MRETAAPSEPVPPPAPVTVQAVHSWIEGYVRAWNTNAADDIRALFVDDALYRTAPHDAPRVGIDAVVDGWIADADAADDHAFRWSVAGIAGDTAFVEGETDYVERDDYSNLWVIVFAADGRAVSFTEWYMTRPGS